MLEKEIESRMCAALQKMGCLTLKTETPGRCGTPDRMIILPNGRIIFVELKQERGRLSPPQKRMIQKLRSMGVEVWVVYGQQQAMGFVDYVKGVQRG